MSEKTYSKPVLTTFGNVAELTRGPSGSGGDAGPNARKQNNE